MEKMKLKNRELVHSYVTSMKRDLVQLVESDEVEDLEDIIKLAHRIQGGSLMFGCENIADLAKKLEVESNKSNYFLVGYLKLEVIENLEASILEAENFLVENSGIK